MLAVIWWWTGGRVVQTVTVHGDYYKATMTDLKPIWKWPRHQGYMSILFNKHSEILVMTTEHEDLRKTTNTQDSPFKTA